MTTFIALHVVLVACLLTSAVLIVRIRQLRREVRVDLPSGPPVSELIIPRQRRRRRAPQVLRSRGQRR